MIARTMVPAGLAAALLFTAGAPVLADPPQSEGLESPAETDPAAAPEEPVGGEIFETIEVLERATRLVGIASSATEGAIGLRDLEKRPLLRPGEVLETVPGVIITQHSGGGKANQLFLRGFNLDHGTDFRVSVGEVQVNLPTHGHGQGYTDLNFLIPELIERVDLKKGPYYAEEGDFSAAGAATIHYLRALPEGLVRLTGGGFDYGRLLVADSIETGGGDLLAALELSHDDGPWERGDDFERTNALLRYSQGDAGRGFSVTAMGYDAAWDSTDQIPRRAVAQGLVGRFGLIDPTVRGESSRYSLSGEVHRSSATSMTRWSGYLLRYDLDLFSNFTYFLDDPENGDQFEQTDRRTAAGLGLRHTRMGTWRDRPLETSYGIQIRSDWIENGLFPTRERQRLGVVREDVVFQATGGPWVETQVRWSDRLRTRVGLRGEVYHADVESGLDSNSGRGSDVLLSPKLSVILGPWKETEVYLNLGYGFHSNDARGAVIRVDPRTGEPIERVDPLVPARGADLGVRTQYLGNLTSTLSFFALELDSELVFVGDAGGTEASRPSRRVGVEWVNTWEPADGLVVDLDVTLTRARFTDADPLGDRIPGAIDATVAAGISVTDWNGVFAGLRLRYFGPRPLKEDGAVRSRSSAMVNGQVGYAFPNGLTLALHVFNVFDREADDIEYYYASRLPGEPPGGVEDVHFHPMEPRSVRLVTGWRF